MLGARVALRRRRGRRRRGVAASDLDAVMVGPDHCGAETPGASGEEGEVCPAAGAVDEPDDAGADAGAEPVAAGRAGAGSGSAGPPEVCARPQSASVVVAGMSRLVGAFGFGSELAELPAPATAVIWQSMPIVLWMAWRRFSEWSALPKAPASPEVVKTSVRTWPSNWPTWALGSTSAQVLRLILVRVCRTSGQARRRTSTSACPPAGAAAAEAALEDGWAWDCGAGADGAACAATGPGPGACWRWACSGRGADSGAGEPAGRWSTDSRPCPACESGARSRAAASSMGQSPVVMRGAARASRPGAPCAADASRPGASCAAGAAWMLGGPTCRSLCAGAGEDAGAAPAGAFRAGAAYGADVDGATGAGETGLP
jgi:hypothetical protein